MASQELVKSQELAKSQRSAGPEALLVVITMVLLVGDLLLELFLELATLANVLQLVYGLFLGEMSSL